MEIAIGTKMAPSYATYLYVTWKKNFLKIVIRNYSHGDVLML